MNAPISFPAFMNFYYFCCKSAANKDTKQFPTIMSLSQSLNQKQIK